MPPRDFSEDGAIGAGSAGSQQTGGFSQSDFGNFGGSAPATGGTAPQWETGQTALDDYTQADIGAMSGAAGSGGFATSSGPSGFQFRKLSPSELAGNKAYTQGMAGGADGMPTPGTYKSGPSGFSFTPTMFAEGGAIPDDNDTNGSPEQDVLSKALSSVDQVLAFGRKLHGLGGGMNEGAIQDNEATQDNEAGSAGSADSPRFQDFRKSPNVEDRRGQQTGPVEGALNDFAGKAYSIYDRATSPNNPIDQSNPIAKDLGGDELSGDKPAIDTDEDNQ